MIAAEAAGLGLNSGESAATTYLGKPGIYTEVNLVDANPDGQVVEPYSISAGLDYPGIGPVHAHLFDTGRAEFVYITDLEAMKAGHECSLLEGIIPAVETAHALAALDELTFKLDDVVVINLSGRGDKDMATYMNYLNQQNG